MVELLQGSILFIAGIVMVYIAWARLNKSSVTGDDMEEEEGIVFDIVKSDRGGVHGPRVDIPVIRFVTKDKYWITEKLEDGFTSGMFKKGEKIKLRYNKSNPKDFNIISTKANIHYVFFMILGFGVSLLGLYKVVKDSFPQFF